MFSSLDRCKGDRFMYPVTLTDPVSVPVNVGQQSSVPRKDPQWRGNETLRTMSCVSPTFFGKSSTPRSHSSGVEHT